MSMNFGVEEYHLPEVISVVDKAMKERKIEIAGKTPVDDFVRLTADKFGMVRNDYVYILSCEYWEEYDPSVNFPMAIAGYYGIRDKYGDIAWDVIWDLKGNDWNKAGVTWQEWLSDEFGLDIEDEEE